MSALEASDSEYNESLMLEQEKTSVVLVAELKKLGIEVEFRWKLLDTKIVDGGQGQEVPYTARFISSSVGWQLGGGTVKEILGLVDETDNYEDFQFETWVIRSRYLIGSDGCRSTVRRKLGIPFKRRTPPDKVYLVNCTFESDMDLSGISIIAGSNNRKMMLSPLSNGYTLPTRWENLHLGVFKPWPAAASPQIKDIMWMTAYQVNECRAERLAHQNQIFLAGDSAHVHSPSGGQGMNTGLQNAHKLAWKLGLVLHGLMPEPMLAIYDERIPMADRAIEPSSKMWQRNNDQAIRYSMNELNRAHESQPSPEHNFQVVIRALDGPFISVDKEETRLHRQMVGTRAFHILVFTSNTLSAQSSSPDNDFAKTLVTTVDTYLAEWRARWHYKTPLLDLTHDKDLFKLYIIAAGSLEVDASRLSDLPQKRRGDG
ncbi:hypothetical protein BGW38_001179 [Lunasporangiospora selenospora]|uniref:FAD-binding domain-containing protein n=1 Tax=Lunasporangiospora selenospora TaxID=979761 RepID=A0A9P6G3R2_9FUNG|nr:hypothetical protein BGW38_001179 [Lunasporangiospora selenospora]